jgi:hypothetical protein
LVIKVSSAKTLMRGLVVAFAHSTEGESHERQRAPGRAPARSIVKDSGELELSLARVATPEPAADEVVLRVEATPINPSDIGLLFGAADLQTLAVRGSGERTVATARIPDAAMKAMAGRLGQSMPVGNEGAAP